MREAAFDAMTHRQEGGLACVPTTRKRKNITPEEKAGMQAAAKLWLLGEHPDLVESDADDVLEREHVLKKQDTRY